VHRLIVLYPPPADPAAFAAYYEGTHLPLVDAMPGIRSYRYSFGVTAPGGGESPYFASFEGDFDDEAALNAALASPEGEAAGADVANFATGGAVLLHYPLTPGAV
jgi:uncharacterized protein (TIGR02118 family)